MIFRSLLAVGSAITLFSIATLGQPVAAQSTTSTDIPTAAATIVNSPDCSPATVIKGLTSIKSANDKAKDMDSLLKLRDQISAQESACNGLFWKGNGAKTIGPLTLETGTYNAHLVTTGAFIADLKVISGSCKADDVMGLFLLMPGSATDGSDALIDSDGCRILIATSNVSAPWTLTLTLIQ